MQARFSLATNFDPELPAELGRFNASGPRARVARVFGGLPADCVGGGRPTYRLPHVGERELGSHVEAMRGQGIQFAYTLNAPDLFGAEEDPAWRAELDAFLGDLRNLGVERLVVSNRWLLRHLRDNHEFGLSMSLINGVSSVEEAVAAKELGVDDIALWGLTVARNLPLIARIRDATDLQIGLNANMACVDHCPWAKDHYRALGLLSREDKAGGAEGWVTTEPHILECSIALLSSPSHFVRTTFVPPSYLEDYERAGIDWFKFSDRASTTETLLRTLQMYGVADEDPDDLYDFVYKGGYKLKAPLLGLFPRDFVEALEPPRISIDGRRFRQERFIERQPTASEDEIAALARTIVTVHDPQYARRYLAFLEAVRAKVAGRPLIPESELPAIHALQAMIA